MIRSNPHAIALFMLGLIGLGALLSTSAFALKPFKAHYEVYFKNIYLGEAVQSFYCQQQQCTFHSQAKPKGIARWFVKETIDETAHWQRDPSTQTMAWQAYEKFNREGNKINKETRFNKQGNELHNPLKTSQRWPWQTNTTDTLSLPYYAMNWIYHRTPEIKNAIDLSVISTAGYFQNVTLKKLGNQTLDINGSRLQTEHYRATHPKATVNIWFAPTLNNFPVQYSVTNHQREATTRLTFLRKSNR